MAEEEQLQQCLADCGAAWGVNFNNTSSTTCLTECLEEAGWTAPMAPDYLNIVWAGFLVVLSATFSGLGLGLMSLDKLGLQVLMDSGEPQEREWAKTIYPIRQKGNLLLCTLLLGNCFVNSFIAILLASITTGMIGLIASTGLILIFGEIIPQAVCSRHGLMIGAKTVWVVRAFVFMFFPVTYPISLILDWVLGREMNNIFSKEELMRLIAIHVEDPHAQMESGLTRDDEKLISGALKYKNKSVKEVMTTLDRAFMLEQSQKLDFETLFEVYKSGFTRIPVYDTFPQNMVGVLYAKDLILVDPDDAIEVRAILSFHGREIRTVKENTSLEDVFREFKTSYIHLLFATNEREQKVDFHPLSNHGHHEFTITGLITLEDVIEELLQTEIVDETDNFIDVNQPMKRVARARKDVSLFLTMLQHKRTPSDALSLQEIEAITTFLSHNLKEFKKLSKVPHVVKDLVRHATLVDRFQDEEDATGANSHVIYERGRQADFLTLVLQGKVVVRSGLDNFESDLGPWSVLAHAAVLAEPYIPDYTAVMYGAGRLLHINRASYMGAWRVMQANYVGKTLETKLDPVVEMTRFGNESPVSPQGTDPMSPFSDSTASENDRAPLLH